MECTQHRLQLVALRPAFFERFRGLEFFPASTVSLVPPTCHFGIGLELLFDGWESILIAGEDLAR
jgi:hypothetical protein